jgi:hypothetical protein
MSYGSVRPFALLSVFALTLCAWPCAPQQQANKDEEVTIVRGRVMNSVTKSAVAHALVSTPGDEYAMFTDDRGQFEFKFLERRAAGNSAREAARVSQRYLEVRKPGFIRQGRVATSTYAPGSLSGESTELTIYAVPEALIVGHLEVPGSEGEVRIQCELYRKGMKKGQETWSPSGRFTTWASGEFRFSELSAGTYKLITHEQMDRDAMLQIPGARMFGYPPVYYPNTTDFSAASAIVVKAGETAQANLTVARQEYFPVRIGVRNAQTARGINVVVSPMGEESPGWSLGYNPAEQTIEGMLPDGTYTVEASSSGEGGSAGILNFSVQGRPLEGPFLNMVPDASLNVNVREIFQTEQSNFANGNEVSGTSINGRRRGNVRVILVPIRELAMPAPAEALPVEGSDGHELVIENVRPGRYRVEVQAQRGYAATIESGGLDLVRQPLVVGLGGGVPRIEVALRDDGGEVDGTMEQASGAQGSARPNVENPSFFYLYLLPLSEDYGRFQMNTYGSPDGTFTVKQVAPGDYLVVAFEAPPEMWAGRIEENLRAWESKGQVIHVQPGQKVSVKVKVIESDQQ